MNKADLVAAVAAKANMTKVAAAAAVDGAIDAIVEAPKKVSKLNRNMAKTIFFTEEIDQKLQMVKAIQKKEIKDVVFAATTMFLDKYYKDGRLSQEGLDFLEQTIY